MTEESINPLRWRMIADMEVRGFTACTQRGYIAAVKNFTAFLGHSPDQADKEDLRRFQHHMRSSGATAANMNLAVSALRFFFGVTLGRGDAEIGMTTVRLPQRLPVILSPEEVAQSLRYYEKKRSQGKTHNQAIRALGRHLCCVIFKMLRQDRPYGIQPQGDLPDASDQSISPRAHTAKGGQPIKPSVLDSKNGPPRGEPPKMITSPLAAIGSPACTAAQQ